MIRNLMVYAAGLAVYLGIGYSTGLLWQISTDYAIPQDDIKAIRLLWFAFLPIGLAMVLMNWLYTTFNKLWQLHYYVDVQQWLKDLDQSE